MSRIGSSFCVTTFGESHGAAVGCVVDGVPPNVPFDVTDVQPLLDRRRPGQSSLTTARDEKDLVEILSGVENGVTLGTPIAMIVRNRDMRASDYENTATVPRPGHADYTYQCKYGIRASSGGGRSSARETIGRVCASGIALKYLRLNHNIGITAFVDSVMDISIPDTVRKVLIENPPPSSSIDSESTLFVHHGFYEDTNGTFYSQEDGSPLDADSVDRDSPVLETRITRCPHAGTAARMSVRIMKMKESRDSCGGTITCVITNLPAGLGEPVFDKFHAAMSQSMLSIPAVKGFEIGSGFEGSRTMKGSEHNDPIQSLDQDEHAVFGSNHAGGVLGGVTSGQHVYFRIALKPVSSIGKTQETCDFSGNKTSLTLTGRHDPCVLPRAVQIVESMAAITVMDFILRQKIRE